MLLAGGVFFAAPAKAFASEEEVLEDDDYREYFEYNYRHDDADEDYDDENVYISEVRDLLAREVVEDDLEVKKADDVEVKKADDIEVKRAEDVYIKNADDVVVKVDDKKAKEILENTEDILDDTKKIKKKIDDSEKDVENKVEDSEQDIKAKVEDSENDVIDAMEKELDALKKDINKNNGVSEEQLEELQKEINALKRSQNNNNSEDLEKKIEELQEDLQKAIEDNEKALKAKIEDSEGDVKRKVEDSEGDVIKQINALWDWLRDLVAEFAKALGLIAAEADEKKK